ncbi:MAG: hypothetical protein ACOH18_02595 [Candidatus Saccharimonadaceae bacterium]
MKYKLDKFFKDKRGKWTLFQFPNRLLLVWIVLVTINLFLRSQAVGLVSSAVLFAWAYSELTEGSSSFRKAMGGFFIIVVVVGYFH